MSHRTDRREFLKKTGATIIFMGAAGCAHVQPRPRRISPNEKLNIACIGAGGKGEGEVNDSNGENLVALCDVDEERAAKTYKRYPDVPRFKDFRVMLDKMGNQIDAVTVSTPDHIHAPAAMMAMAMGKHAFVQKPLTRTIWEARQLAKAASKYGVATQMGNQGTSTSGLRRAVEIIQAGVLGPVRRLHVWTNRPIWPQGQKALDERKRRENEPIPDTLDWELWLGPAPKRRFNRIYLPFNWRGWYDWGTGAFGDMACHTLNMPYWGLKLCPPSAVEGKVENLMEEVYPSGSTVDYYFPAREGLPPVHMTWYDGDKKPNAEQLDLPEGERVSGSGALVVGEKGMLYSDGDYGDRWHLTPKENFDGVKMPDETIPRSPGHFKEWIDACKGGKPAMSNFPGYASLLTEIVDLGCVAQRLPGRRIEWDGKKLKAKNCPEAAALVKPDIPKEWWV